MSDKLIAEMRAGLEDETDMDARIAYLQIEALKTRQKEHKALLDRIATLEAENARIKALEAVIRPSYMGLLVLRTMLKRVGLEAGEQRAREILAEMATVMPELPALSSLRGNALDTGHE